MKFKSVSLRGGIYRGQQTIPTNGLVLYLDSGNPASYPGTGTNWYDLSPMGYVASINTGVAYSADNSGIFNFDGGPGSLATLGGGFGYDYSAGVLS